MPQSTNDEGDATANIGEDVVGIRDENNECLYAELWMGSIWQLFFKM